MYKELCLKNSAISNISPQRGSLRRFQQIATGGKELALQWHQLSLKEMKGDFTNKRGDMTSKASIHSFVRQMWSRYSVYGIGCLLETKIYQDMALDLKSTQFHQGAWGELNEYKGRVKSLE